MSIQVDIDNALTAAVEEIEASGTFSGIPFEYPNRVLDPTPEQYVQMVQFRNNQQNYAWADGTIYPGILQLNVIGKVGEGSIPTLALAEAIAAAFPKGRTMFSGAASVKIEVEPEVLTPLQDGHKVTVPVSVRYRCST